MMRFFRRAPSDDPQAFGTFLHGQGAFVAQKTVLDYCRVKVRRDEKRIFGDAGFQAALSHCRWRVFFAALGDVVAVAEAHLRPLAEGREPALAAALAALHRAALALETPPEAEAEAQLAASDAMPRRLAGLQMAPPLLPHRMPMEAEPVLFATLPIHADQRIGESEAIRGALRFHLVTTQQEMERRFDAAKLSHRLLA